MSESLRPAKQSANDAIERMRSAVVTATAAVAIVYMEEIGAPRYGRNSLQGGRRRHVVEALVVRLVVPFHSCSLCRSNHVSRF